MTFFSLQNLNFKYPNSNQFIFSDFNFSLEQKTILAILGASGSGKTTLLKLLAGLLEYEEGEIWLNNEKLFKPSEQLIAGHQEITLVKQDFDLFPNHTIEENILYPIRKLHPEDQEEKLQELLKLCKLENFAKKYPTQLSGGQQQRIALAQALANEPSVILLDEPFSQLDTHLKEDLRRNLREILKESETTVILVLHDPKDALMLADKIMVLEKGKILQLGTPQDIYEKPTNKEVASLLGRCNFVEGKLLKQKQGLYLLRYEDIEIANQNNSFWQGKVEEVTYLAYKNLLEVKIEDSLVLFTEHRDFEVKSENQVSLLWKKAWSFMEQKYVYP